MRKLYRIKIGEKVYEVELEEVTEKEGKVEVIENKTEERRENSQTVGGTTVEAPMQGLVLSVLVSQGEKVKAGQELVIIEAMKMENPIVAPIDGTVESVNVSKGDIVETGNPIVTLI